MALDPLRTLTRPWVPCSFQYFLSKTQEGRVRPNSAIFLVKAASGCLRLPLCLSFPYVGLSLDSCAEQVIAALPFLPHVLNSALSTLFSSCFLSPLISPLPVFLVFTRLQPQRISYLLVSSYSPSAHSVSKLPLFTLSPPLVLSWFGPCVASLIREKSPPSSLVVAPDL